MRLPSLPRLRSRARRTERGAPLIEAAIALPVIFLLTFGLIDGGMYFKGYLSAGYAAQSGARAASAAGADSLADYDVLKAVATSRPALGSGLEYVVVFKAASSDDPVPPECVATSAADETPSGVAGVCNVYTADDVARPMDDFIDGDWEGAQFWPGTDRGVSRSEGPDLLGVGVVAQVATPGGILGKSSYTVTRVTVHQLEARLS